MEFLLFAVLLLFVLSGGDKNKMKSTITDNVPKSADDFTFLFLLFFGACLLIMVFYGDPQEIMNQTQPGVMQNAPPNRFDPCPSCQYQQP